MGCAGKDLITKVDACHGSFRLYFSSHFIGHTVLDRETVVLLGTSSSYQGGNVRSIL